VRKVLLVCLLCCGCGSDKETHTSGRIEPVVKVLFNDIGNFTVFGPRDNRLIPHHLVWHCDYLIKDCPEESRLFTDVPPDKPMYVTWKQYSVGSGTREKYTFTFEIHIHSHKDVEGGAWDKQVRFGKSKKFEKMPVGVVE